MHAQHRWLALYFTRRPCLAATSSACLQHPVYQASEATTATAQAMFGRVLCMQQRCLTRRRARRAHAQSTKETILIFNDKGRQTDRQADRQPCIYVRMHVCMYACMCACMYMYMYMYVCMCACTLYVGITDRQTEKQLRQTQTDTDRYRQTHRQTDRQTDRQIDR